MSRETQAPGKSSGAWDGRSPCPESCGTRVGIWSPGQCGLEQWPHPGSSPRGPLDLEPGQAGPGVKIQPAVPRTELWLHPGLSPSPIAVLLPLLVKPQQHACQIFPSSFSLAQKIWVGVGVGRQTERYCSSTSGSHTEPVIDLRHPLCQCLSNSGARQNHLGNLFKRQIPWFYPPERLVH